MNARSTRGPGGGRTGGRRPAVRKGGGRSGGGGGGGILTGCEMAIPLLPVLVLYALAVHLHAAWRRRTQKQSGPLPHEATR